MWNFWFKQITSDPLDVCSVKNCIFIFDKMELHKSDAVVVDAKLSSYPWVHKRKRTQRWIFVSDESPVATSLNPTNLSKIANIYNWSMTYRSDSDVPIPYGRTVALPEVLMHKISSESITKHIPYWENKQKDVLVAALITRCTNEEGINYVKELRKYIKVDLLNECADSEVTKSYRCLDHPVADCPKIANYHFYLAIESARCRQYLTEKVFYSAFAKGAIPIVMGPSISDCTKLLPPDSFLHVNSFDFPRDLAVEIMNLSKDDEYLQMFHKWRRFFKVVNEHGFFGTNSMQLCRLCEALNYNDNETKIYDKNSLEVYLDPFLLCTSNTSNY
ncbi:alpha-(1,3)-fucosyltransferase 6-like isoform X1 [Ostrinia furnacalis]|uniref:alpha-(1,3)-fucosyltransferase 6-like isoform X1 n=1 Tax=Ostrinia furnacalis TaxID=93504 RepID=UPI00103F1301|nr:alpha-(1,3)-fucosyltransferase 6-like isoform X1 [Ostrinia furnacalis]